MTSPAAAPQRRVVHCMGTVFSFDVRDPGVSVEVLDAAEAWLHSVDARYSPYKEDSVVSRLARGELTPGGTDDEVRWVLDRCAALQRETGGSFSAYYAGRLDPSGFVKGWAIERASDLLAAAGSHNHSVNGGGDVQCVGEAAPGQPWRIGIVDPRDRRQILAVVSARDLAVATSGTAERGVHVLDPHTGRPPRGLLSVTVAGPRLGVADAYATAAFAMGERARDWLAALPGHLAYVVAEDGSTWSSGETGRESGGGPTACQPASASSVTNP